MGARNHWLGLELVSTRGHPIIGARVALVNDGKKRKWRRTRRDGSYASANDPRVIIGLSGDAGDQHLFVLWPDGRRESFTGLAADRYHRIERGKGRPADD